MGLRVCPNCGSSYMEMGQEKLEECSNCGFSFTAAINKPPLPVSSAPKQADTTVDTSSEHKQKKTPNSRTIAYIVIAIGIVLVCIGLLLQVPSKELTTYSFMEDSGYSVIEEYVGGDAYNYIIGAALVAGEIAGVMIQKAIFISIGLLISCIGLLKCTRQDNEKKNVPDSQGISEDTGHE